MTALCVHSFFDPAADSHMIDFICFFLKKYATKQMMTGTKTKKILRDNLIYSVKQYANDQCFN